MDISAMGVSKLIRLLSAYGQVRLLRVVAHMRLPKLPDSDLFLLMDACFRRADLRQARVLSESITTEKQWARKAQLTREWIRFHQGDYSGGWPTYPGVMNFRPGSALGAYESSADVQGDGPILIPRATYPDALESRLGLRPWSADDAADGPLLVWFNFNSSIGGEILCSRLVRSFQRKMSRPLILAVDNRHKGLCAATFTDCLVLGKNDDLRALPDTCRHYILARDMARHVIASDEDFVPIAAETMALPVARKLPDLPGPAGLPKIAISWKTTNSDQGQYRNIPIEKLAALLSCHTATYYAAQHGDITEDRRILLRHLGDRVQFDCFHAAGDSHDMGHFLRRMDAVITIDNSLLHLCGALGVRTFALLSRPSYWAWPESGTWSRWYDSVHIIRQARPGRNWRPVLKSLDVVLGELLKEGGTT